jgi:hypothetical protein
MVSKDSSRTLANILSREGDRTGADLTDEEPSV